MNGRLVWISEEEIAKAPGWVWDKYRAAPADPAEAIARVLQPFSHHLAVARIKWETDTKAVLRALGAPNE